MDKKKKSLKAKTIAAVKEMLPNFVVGLILLLIEKYVLN